MPIQNMEVAEQFNRLANLLEIEGANPFRVRAYRTAARVIAGLATSVAELITQGEDLTTLPGIGSDLAEKIKLIIETGELPLLKEVETRLPPLLNELMDIEGLGPKRIQIIYKQLKIADLEELKTALATGRLQKIKGFGEKIEKKIAQGILHAREHKQRFALTAVIPVVHSLTQYLQAGKEVEHVICAGSYRRRRETVADLDFVVTGKNGEEIINYFINYPEIAEIFSHGATRSSVRLRIGQQVDLRVVPEESYGAALLYFTGSKDHNIAIRKMGVHKKLKINEYGVFKGKKQLAGSTEENIYAQVGLPYIPPELREDRGEIAAAQTGTLPTLIELCDLRGDLNLSGAIANGECKQGSHAYQFQYVAKVFDVKKLSRKDLHQQLMLIDDFNAQSKNFYIFKALAVEIESDGELSAAEALLKKFDVTICRIQKDFSLTQKKQTERFIRAIAHPFCTILGFPKVTLPDINFSYDKEKIFLAAKEYQRILELSANPSPFELHDIDCKLAKNIGVKITVTSAAQKITQLNQIEYALWQARRGWLAASDVVNTLSVKDLMALLKRK